MNILLTGASSFTGHWFVLALHAAGHRVTATFQREAIDAYPEGVRQQRVAGVLEHATPVWSCSFGSERFMQALGEGGFDLVCHHAADVTDYKSPDFDVNAAVANNTRQAKAVCESLAARNARLLITGSVFEGGEGAGSEGLPHFSPYGLSKALSAQVFAYYAQQAGVPLGKFVIPNPFGPLEEPRFTRYLVRTWYAGETASVKTPAYVRDNIHVDLLARCYADFAAASWPADALARCAPSGYVESQGAFAQRFAREMAPRLGLPCRVELFTQREFAEPRIRLNTEMPDAAALDFDESAAWDAIGDFYRAEFAA